jgi:hypothetical protein
VELVPFPKPRTPFNSWLALGNFVPLLESGFIESGSPSHRSPMTSPRIVEILYQMIAFLFAISVHESAHAWTGVGIFALLALIYLGGGLLSGLIRPFLRFYVVMLSKF